MQNGSYVKVGKFERGTVAYHDDLEGSLISTADKVVDLIYLKYLKAKMSGLKEATVTGETRIWHENH